MDQNRLRVTALGAALCALLLAAGCGRKAPIVPPGTAQADKVLFDRATAALNEKKWLAARNDFRQVVDNYPQSPFRPDAKLGVGDTYLGENTSESLVLAANEFREFLTYFPKNDRADYAQYKLGLAHFNQMLGPDRDQTETKAALKEFEAFMARFGPNSPAPSKLIPEVQEKLRQTKDRLSESGYRVGLFYFRSRYYPGAIDRFRQVLKEDPEYTLRDALYYYYAESLIKVDQPAAALPLYQRLVDEFQTSEYLERAKLRIEELKSGKVVKKN